MAIKICDIINPCFLDVSNKVGSGDIIPDPVTHNVGPVPFNVGRCVLLVTLNVGPQFTVIPGSSDFYSGSLQLPLGLLNGHIVLKSV